MFLSNPLRNVSVLSRSVNLIGCHGNQNAKFAKKYKNHLLKSHKGDEAENLQEYS